MPLEPDSGLTTRCPQCPMVTNTSNSLPLRGDCGFPSVYFLGLQLSLPSCQNQPLEFSLGSCLIEVSYIQFSLMFISVICILDTTLVPSEAKKWVTSVTLGASGLELFVKRSTSDKMRKLTSLRPVPCSTGRNNFAPKSKPY